MPLKSSAAGFVFSQGAAIELTVDYLVIAGGGGGGSDYGGGGGAGGYRTSYGTGNISGRQSSVESTLTLEEDTTYNVTIGGGGGGGGTNSTSGGGGGSSSFHTISCSGGGHTIWHFNSTNTPFSRFVESSCMTRQITANNHFNFKRFTRISY